MKLLHYFLIFLSIESYAALTYNLHPADKLRSMTLHELELHYAEILTSKGHALKNPFLQKQAHEKLKKQSFKKTPNKMVHKRTITKYLKRLKHQIQTKHNAQKKQMLTQLRKQISKKADIQLSILSNLDNNTTYELVVILRYPFDLKSTQHPTSTHQNYYKKANNLFLGVLSDGKLTQTQLSSQAYGKAEYINTFKIHYETGADRPQIQVIMHSFDLSQTSEAGHSQSFSLFLYDAHQITRTLTYDPFYKSFNQDTHEHITEHTLHTKNNTSNNTQELIFKGQTKKVTFSDATSVFESAHVQILETWERHFIFDMKKKEHTLISTQNT